MVLSKFPVRFKEQVEVAPSVYLITLDTDSFDFQAGQFLTFFLEQEGKLRPRSYSLFSPPKEDAKQLLVEYIPDGLAGTAFSQATQDSEFQATGPLGVFTFNNEVNNHVFIATNTGLAPIHSMIKEHFSPDQHFTLIFGAKYLSGLFFHEEWKKLDQEHDNFTYKPTITREENSEVTKGRVQQLIEIKQDTNYYICGSAPMVKETVELLKKNEIKKERIHYEIF